MTKKFLNWESVWWCHLQTIGEDCKTMLTRKYWVVWDKLHLNWVCQGCILSSCLFNLHVEYIMQNARLDEWKAGIKTMERWDINNLWYVDDTTLEAEREGELKSLLLRVKEESEKAGLKLNIQRNKIMSSGPFASWQIDGKKWKQWQILFSWPPKSLQTVTAAMKLEDACSLVAKLWQS